MCYPICVEAPNQWIGMRSLPPPHGTQISLGVPPYFPGRAVGWGYQGVGVAALIRPTLPPLWQSVRGCRSNFRQVTPPLGRVVGYYFLMDRKAVGTRQLSL